MTTDNCKGKTQVESAVADILEITKENRSYSEELRAKLIKDLCCLTYPVKETYFDFKRFWFKTRVVNKGLTVWWREDNYYRTTITVKSELPFRWPHDSHETFEVIAITVKKPEEGLYSNLQTWDYPKYSITSYDEFLASITKRIAEYTVNTMGTK